MATVLVALVFAGGCTEGIRDFLKTDTTRLFNPGQVVNKRPRSTVKSILPTLGSADETQELPPGARFPRPADHSYTDVDYQIGPTDILDISILDLFRDGQETLLRREVSDTGYIDLPLLDDRIPAEGLAKEQLKQSIADAYSPNILRDPTVSVTLIARRQSVYSISGAVDRPGTYNIRRRGMRVLEAIAQGGGITQANIPWVLVIRHAPAKRVRADGSAVEGSGNGGGNLPDLPTLPDLPDTGGDEEPADANDTATPADTSDLDRRIRDLIDPEGGDANDVTPSALTLSENGGDGQKLREGAAKGESRWIRSGGESIRVEQVTAGDAIKPNGDDELKDPYGWAGTDMGDSEIIALNRKKLEQGDPMMNIVLRDNDVVQVPTLEVGEFYVMGEISRPGVYSLTGREVTVKMAIAAAGGFGAVAWPENTILIRRVADNAEQIAPLDLQAIFQGERPDVMLKPNDVIAIGSDIRAPFYAVIRNAFRMTYGFGFIYDRNLAFQLPNATSRRFTRW